MPKGILEFSLPEEDEQFREAVYGGRLKGAVQDFDQWLRHIVKHGEEKDQNLKAQDVRNKLYELAGEWLNE